MSRRDEIQKRLSEIQAGLQDIHAAREKFPFRPAYTFNTPLAIANEAALQALYSQRKRLVEERARLQRELENLGKPKPPEGFEIIDAEEAQKEGDRLYLVLTERDADGEVEMRTHLASFSDMKFMDSLGQRLAKLCLETAQAELAGRTA